MIDIDQLVSQLTSGVTIRSDEAAVAIPANSTLVDMERFRPRPDRQRAVFSTSDLGSFVMYCASYGIIDDALVTLDPRQLTVDAILDYGTAEEPMWGQHGACFRAELSPLADQLKRMEGAVLQDRMVEFIDDWHGYLTFLRGGEVIPTPEARRQFSDLTVERVRQVRSQTQSFQRERSAAEKMTMGAGLPDELVINTEVFQGLPALRVSYALKAAESGADAAVNVRPVGWDEVVRNAAHELQDAIKEGLDDWPVLLGKVTFTK